MQLQDCSARSQMKVAMCSVPEQLCPSFTNFHSATMHMYKRICSGVIVSHGAHRMSHCCRAIGE